MSSDRLRAVFEACLAAHASGAISLRGRSFVARRSVPKNVWKIESSGGDEWHLKFCRSAARFQRELAGVELSRRLACEHPWCMAVEVVYVDEDQHAVATTRMPGVSGQRLFQTILRWDRALSACAQARREALAAFRLIWRWIAAWQRITPPRHEFHYDHTLSFAATTIDWKIENLRPFLSDSQRAELERMGRLARRASAHEDPQDGKVLIHGDLTSGNIFFHQGRIGVIDFEDMGVGPAYRDALWIAYNLQRLLYHPLYRKKEVTRLLQVVSRRYREVDARERAVHECGFLVSEMIWATQNPHGWRRRLSLPNSCFDRLASLEAILGNGHPAGLESDGLEDSAARARAASPSA